MTLALLIGGLGALGAVLRYVVLRLAESKPIVMLAAVNLGGSALAGVLGALAATEVTAALILGFCGGITTFSTVSVQIVRVAKEQSLSRAAGVALVHGVGSGIVAILGFGLTFALT